MTTEKPQPAAGENWFVKLPGDIELQLMTVAKVTTKIVQFKTFSGVFYGKQLYTDGPTYALDDVVFIEKDE